MATLYERAEVHLFKLCQGQGGVFRAWERYAVLTLVKQTFGVQHAWAQYGLPSAYTKLFSSPCSCWCPIDGRYNGRRS